MNNLFVVSCMFKCIVFSSMLLLLWESTKAQVKTDSSASKELSVATVKAVPLFNNIYRLDPVSGTYIYDGKKNEVVSLKNMDAIVTDKSARQIFAKVPGVFVYDMDGAGNQLNIATRGLDPHRGWELNIRKDGVITNSDMYGYPASHYSIPLESVDRIEWVRGTGSLQYGAQFGGMLNYVTKQADTNKRLSFESYNTMGTYNMVSTYNAIGGKIGKLKYYAYSAKRTRDGYRAYEHTNYDAQSIAIDFACTKAITIKAEWARSNYLYQTPGPLTQQMFTDNPRQATRTRNYFSPTINIPSVKLNWQITKRAQLEYTSSALIGARKSVLFDKPATIGDTINNLTNNYNNRQVDIDSFNSYTNELRLLKKYSLHRQTNSIAFGLQYMNNHLHRNQQGKGTTGNDYSLVLNNATWGRDVHFKSHNIALYAENNFKINSKLSINAGARYESGYSKMTGTIIYYLTDKIPIQLNRNFVLLGTSLNYKLKTSIDFYGGIAQAYRPMIFKDLIPSDAYEKVNPNIKDAKGYNAEMGFRGSYKFLKWDITGFLLQYNNRMGSVLQTDTAGQLYTYKTNIGDSRTVGLEMFVQGNWCLAKNIDLAVYTSTSLMEGKYENGIIKSGTNNIDITGNAVESVPKIISRNGISAQYCSKYSISILYSYTSKTFADALNTSLATPNGALGIVPSYTLIDFNFSAKISSSLIIKGAINNVFNKSYFTKRPLFYPGPGIWPSDGRNSSLSAIIKL